MVWLLRKCRECNRYTMSTDSCKYCKGDVQTPHPPKYSPNDKYLRHRMALKREAER